MPLISVIIPVYNGERTIQQTVESVLAQTLKDFELIIINDGSQDKTLEIVSQIKDSRIKVFSYPNARQAASRNRGISHATGEYIAFLDADDLWTSDKLEAQFKALQENPEAAVAYSWTNYIDESGKFLRRASHTNASGNVYAKLLLTDFLDNGSNPLIRREAFTQVGVFDESLPPAEDWDMWLRLAARYHFVVVPYTQILYRVSANSESSNVWLLESACLKVIEKAFEQAPESLQYLKKYSLANIYRYVIYKVLEGYPKRKKGITAAKFFWHCLRNDPALLRTKVIWKITLKISVIIILPPQIAQGVITKFKGVFNTITILGYMQSEPF